MRGCFTLVLCIFVFCVLCVDIGDKGVGSGEKLIAQGGIGGPLAG